MDKLWILLLADRVFDNVALVADRFLNFVDYRNVKQVLFY
jgi:hypothetical protein